MFIASNSVSASEPFNLTQKIKSVMEQKIGKYPFIEDKENNNYRYRIRDIAAKYNPPPASKDTVWVGSNIVHLVFIAKKGVESVSFFWEGENTNYFDLSVSYGEIYAGKDAEAQQFRLKMPNGCMGPWNLIIAAKKNNTIFFKRVKVGIAAFDCGAHS